MLRLSTQDLTPDAFAPFGEVIGQPARSPDAAGPGWQWWGETALLEPDARPYGVGYLDLRPAELRFDWAERHMRSAEMLIPSGGDCLVYVGPADHPDEPDRPPPLERFQVFRVRQGQGVLLRPGVWHGAPLALGTPLNVVVLLLQGTGAADTSLVRFANTPVAIDQVSD
jgi:ureidoglycolate hydrolase